MSDDRTTYRNVAEELNEDGEVEWKMTLAIEGEIPPELVEVVSGLLGDVGSRNHKISGFHPTQKKATDTWESNEE